MGFCIFLFLLSLHVQSKASGLYIKRFRYFSDKFKISELLTTIRLSIHFSTEIQGRCQLRFCVERHSSKSEIVFLICNLFL